MSFEDFFRNAKSKIIILGVNSLIPYLEKSAQFFTDLLTVNKELNITIICESDSECFNQSLLTDTDFSKNRTSFASLLVHRDRIIGKTGNDGLLFDIKKLLKSLPNYSEELLESHISRISIKQCNLRLPINIIQVDGEIHYCMTTTSLPTINSYQQLVTENLQYNEILNMVDFYINKKKGGIYLSKPREELIQLYDRKGYPRGIFPRACFYTTEYERYSIWGFIFNRKGQLLLHQRSHTTSDGRGLWDKSVGGHVDLRDSSTFITAQRELVEEMFLPEAEYSKYIQADLGDIIHFGEWNTNKRPESGLKIEINGLAPADWVMFRATDDNGEPLTVTRVSDRRIHDKEGNVSYKRTVFRSDVFLFIAPCDYLDTDEQRAELLENAEKAGAAQAHKALKIEELRAWIHKMEEQGKDRETFTDDILFINLRFRELLISFAEFVKFLQ